MLIPLRRGFLVWVRFEAAAEHHPCLRVEDGNDVAPGSQDMNNEAGEKYTTNPHPPGAKSRGN